MVLKNEKYEILSEDSYKSRLSVIVVFLSSEFFYVSGHTYTSLPAG